MIRRLSVLLTATLIGVAFLMGGRSTIHVDAAPSTLLGGPLAASYFPGGSNHELHKHMGNNGYTCFWAIDCTSAMPAFHSDVADDLGRTGGWAQVETTVTTIAVQGKHKAYTHQVAELFAITVSSFTDGPTPYLTYPGPHGAATGYAGMTASQAAYTDFNAAQLYAGFDPIDAQPQYVTAGESTTLELDNAPLVVQTAAFYSGNVDVEAVALCEHCASFQIKDMKTRFAAALTALGAKA